MTDPKPAIQVYRESLVESLKDTDYLALWAVEVTDLTDADLAPTDLRDQLRSLVAQIVDLSSVQRAQERKRTR